jgi:hypothetical protein
VAKPKRAPCFVAAPLATTSTAIIPTIPPLRSSASAPRRPILGVPASHASYASSGLVRCEAS